MKKIKLFIIKTSYSSGCRDCGFIELDDSIKICEQCGMKWGDNDYDNTPHSIEFKKWNTFFTSFHFKNKKEAQKGLKKLNEKWDEKYFYNIWGIR